MHAEKTRPLNTVYFGAALRSRASLASSTSEGISGFDAVRRFVQALKFLLHCSTWRTVLIVEVTSPSTFAPNAPICAIFLGGGSI